MTETLETIEIETGTAPTAAVVTESNDTGASGVIFKVATAVLVVLALALGGVFAWTRYLKPPAPERHVLLELAAVAAHLGLVLAHLLPLLRALHTRLGDLPVEVLVEGRVERPEARRVAGRRRPVVVGEQRAHPKRVAPVVGELAPVLPQVLPVLHALQLVPRGLRLRERRSQHHCGQHQSVHVCAASVWGSQTRHPRRGCGASIRSARSIAQPPER